MLHIFLQTLKKLRREADAHAQGFTSDGFTTLFAMLQQELDDAYLATVEAHLRG